MKRVRIKIGEDGFYSEDTAITDADTGALIERVQRVQISPIGGSMDSGIPHAKIQVRGPEVDVIAWAEITEREFPKWTECDKEHAGILRDVMCRIRDVPPDLDKDFLTHVLKALLMGDFTLAAAMTISEAVRHKMAIAHEQDVIWNNRQVASSRP